MSAFLIHQEPEYAVMLADSLATKPHPQGGAALPLAASKLVSVVPGVYAAHAGTWQPAVRMLSALRENLLSDDVRSWERLTTPLKAIGEETYAECARSFGNSSFDVRVALVVTGMMRHPDDVERGISSSIVLWEAARGFEPAHVRGHLHFAGSKPLSSLATSFLSQSYLVDMMRQSPLACAQAVLAVHAALARLSTEISPDANAIVVGGGGEHAIIQGSVLQLPQSALLRG